MMKSMTGYGSGSVDIRSQKWFVEIRAVNHRYLEVKFRGFGDNPLLEMQIQTEIKKKIARGSITVHMYSRDPEPVSTVAMDELAFSSYQKTILELAVNKGFDVQSNERLFYHILGIKGVMKEINGVSKQIIRYDEIEPALIQAIDLFDKFRLQEGSLLAVELQKYIMSISDKVLIMKRVSLSQVPHRVHQLKERLKQLALQVQISDERIAAEVVMWASAVDVEEELSRLQVHLEHFYKMINTDGLVGKSMDFLSQEMLRETNTIGSKCQSIEITEQVLAIKAILEKIREQVQNIE